MDSVVVAVPAPLVAPVEVFL